LYQNFHNTPSITIPAWLNYKAEEAGVNFSQELQNALKQRRQIAL